MVNSVFKSEQGQAVLYEFYDGIQAQWSFPHAKQMIPTRFGDTHTITAGEPGSPVLVLLHGAASNALGWGGAIPAYSSGFHVIAPDIPGEAGKSALLRPSWDNDDYILWLDDVLDHFKVGSVALLGLSLGGWIAAKYASLRPQRVDHLVLLAPGGIAPAKASAILRTVVYSMQKEKGAEKMKRLVFGKGDILPEVSRFFDLIQEHYIPRFGSPKLLTDKELTAIACPVLMASGGEDAFFHAGKTAARLKKLVPHAEIFIDPQGRHGITEYGGMIAQFLR